ncbi:tetratricopeptide repeat protein [Gammaproteobacteria bacterium]|nr:tetratricopeptide repeat protein [Gammaproteobacteria bacterium]
MDNKQSKGSIGREDGHRAPLSAELKTVISAYQNGDFKNAAEKAILFTNKFPDDPVALSILANSQYQLGWLDASITTMERIIILSPDDYKIHNNLGLAYQRIGEAEKAVKIINVALKINPAYGEAYYNLGVVLFDLENFNECIVNYEQSIALRPTHVGSYNNLGIAKKQAGRIYEAEECYRAAIEIDPNFADPYYNLGILKLEAGDMLAAEEYFRKAIELRPNYSEAYLNLGIVLAEQGNLLAAKNTFEEITIFDPTYSQAYSLLGKTQFSLGNEEEAMRCLWRALEIDPGDLEACRELGSLNMSKKNYILAASLYSNSTTLANGVEFLECCFHIDTEGDFRTKLSDYIDNNPISATIGSLVNSFNLKYGQAVDNPFCGEPFKYSLNTNLNSFLDFEKQFREPVYKALNNKIFTYRYQGLLTKGKQTAGNIFKHDSIRMSEIENIIRSEIEKYRRNFYRDGEGIFKKWPKQYALNGWLVRMEEGGSLSPHIHKHGWLTGSVYINVPSPKANNEGDLVISRTENSTLDLENSLVMEVSTGHMCLFPSSLYHHTLPFKGEEERIVLAFDVVPTL